MTINPDTNKQIAAIVPRYTDSGSLTVIMNTDGSQGTTSAQTRTLLRRLASKQAFDLSSLQKRSGEITQRRMFQPLPLGTGLLLFPLKVRLPRVAGDTTTGYVNVHALSAITKTTESPYQALLLLKGGWKLPVIWSTDTVKKHVHHAKLSAALPVTATNAPGELQGIAQKLVEVFYEILSLKRNTE